MGRRRGVHRPLLAVVALALATLPPALAATTDTVQVVVNGEAAAGSDRPYGTAVRHALWNAIREVIEREALPPAKLKGFLEGQAERLSRCEGSIVSWKVEDRQKTDERLVLTVRVEVLPLTLRDQLIQEVPEDLAVGLFYEWVGRPRIAVIVEEKVDGEPSELMYARSALEEALLDKGARLVDIEQVRELIERDAARVVGDPARAAELGQQLGADLLITGNASSKLSRELPSPIEGDEDKYAVYTSYLNLRGIRSSTGEILFSRRFDNRDQSGLDISALGKQDAILKSLENLTEIRSAELLGAIASGWRRDLLADRTFTVRIADATYDDLAGIERALSSLPLVESVTRRGHGASLTTYDVAYGGMQPAFEAELLRLRRPSFRIERSEERTLGIAIGKRASRAKPAAATPVAKGGVESSVDVVVESLKDDQKQRVMAWLRSQGEIVEAEERTSGIVTVLSNSVMSAADLMKRIDASNLGVVALGLDWTRLSLGSKL